jgi:hypothetical protein
MTRQQLMAPGAVTFGVLGPVTAATEHGPVALRGHRQRLVLARLLIAHGRVVPVDRLVDDLWEVAPEGAAGPWSPTDHPGSRPGSWSPSRPGTC